MRPSVRLLAFVAFTPLAALASDPSSPYALFESGPVRPLALSPSGGRLFAVNTPDNRLEILRVDASGLTHEDSVAVGLEPVAVAARSDSEVWVVNHLSDSVSIVKLEPAPARVVRTLWVGDEPRDIVFAGPNHDRAFITAAHRGQHLPMDPEVRTPGVARADVWVFDANQVGASAGGAPLTIVRLFGDTPRALAATPDGATVYAAVFLSGNRTSIVAEAAVCDGGAAAPPCEVEGRAMPGGLLGPNTDRNGVPGPETGLIVRFEAANGKWEDELSRDWSNAVNLDLPDYDVFAIDAAAAVPEQTSAWSGVGTVIFNLAVNPISGAVYATNSDARNHVRFESNVRGHAHEARISVLGAAGAAAIHLNPHIDYGEQVAAEETRLRTLSQPLGMAVSADGRQLFLAAFGSGKVAVFETAQLEFGSGAQSSRQITVTGGGSAGVVLDERFGRLYVSARFDNAVAVIDPVTGEETQRVSFFDAEPESIRTGRRIFYDAGFSSSNGEAACASCHVFGDNDGLAWDLGDPGGVVIPNPNPVSPDSVEIKMLDFHPLKGPMITQTLRGMATHGPMHWRGDRTGGLDADGDPLDERAALRQFNPAFVSLLGRAAPLDQAQFEALSDFLLAILPPPNPLRALDNSLTEEQAHARRIFVEIDPCGRCHSFDPAQGFFGTRGVTAAPTNGNGCGATQVFKAAQLRTVYQKIGKFGMFPKPAKGIPAEHVGPQVRGFGFTHDGHLGDIVESLAPYVLVFDSNFAPILGQQLTLNAETGADGRAFAALLEARAEAADCDLIAKGEVGGEQRGWKREIGGAFRADRRGEALWSLEQLGAAARAGQAVTLTCVPLGTGERMGIDRDGDGAFDRDEIDAGTDPADPRSLPATVTPGGPTETITATRRPTSTETPGPTSTPSDTSAATPEATATPTIEPCTGDCNSDREVTVDELVLGVNVALGSAGIDRCSAMDRSGEGQVTVDELVAAVGATLSGCPP